jgi:UDP-3-O-[3-hydroxymyristoyl] glucosamine N-acyltransferase
MPALTLAELQAQLGGTLTGDGSVLLASAASLEQAQSDQLSFVLGQKYLPQAQASHAGALVAPEKMAPDLTGNLLLVANPHAVFARALALLYPAPQPDWSIHPAAHLADDAVIGAGCRIGPGTVVESGAVIEPGCQIGPHCHIGPGVHLGADCLLHSGVRIQHGCRVGARAILHPGCVIGSDGFGLAWEADHWVKVPQVGRVVLGDDVEIGANTTIDRGALDDTVIEDGAKLDNQIHVAHNCRIGRHTAIAGCVGIAGSTRIGAYCQIGGAAMIIGHLEICDRVTVSAGSFVAKDIRHPGVYTSVQPLMPHEDWKRNAAHLRHLDSLSKRIRALEKLLKDKA